MEPLKLMWTEELLQEFGLAVRQVYGSFDSKAFVARVMDEHWGGGGS